jgi:glutamate dehydrogenase/leucine dehydrogenase
MMSDELKEINRIYKSALTKIWSFEKVEQKNSAIYDAIFEAYIQGKEKDNRWRA